MFEYIILGIVQGLAEWLPISSEGFIVLIQNTFYQSGSTFDFIGVALFLHIGTFLAAIVYFKKDVKQILSTLWNFKKANLNDKKLFIFLFISTLISGAIGALILLVLLLIENLLALTGEILAILIGFLLLLTSVLSFKTKESGHKEQKNLTIFDGVILGISQGLTALPGLSRSGTTVAFLLMRGFKDEEALRLSFLMSIPIVLVANIGLNLIGGFSPTLNSLVGVLFAFIFGLLTIDWLMQIARKIKFAWFTLIFGILIILSVFIF